MTTLSVMVASPKAQFPPDIAGEMAPERQAYRLMLLREALGMKPSEIADNLGIERTYWTRFEKAHRPISNTVAALLCVKYGVSLDWLVLGKWDKLSLDMAEKLRAAEASLNN